MEVLVIYFNKEHKKVDKTFKIAECNYIKNETIELINKIIHDPDIESVEWLEYFDSEED